MKNIILILFLIIKSQASVVEFDIKTIVRLAIEKDLGSKITREKLEQIKIQKKEAISTLFPTINATSSLLEKKDPKTNPQALFDGDKYNFYDVGVQLTQPIFRGGLYSATSDYYNYEKSIQNLELEIAKRNIILRAMEQFYTILLISKKIETFKKIEKLDLDLLQTAQRKARLGVGKNLSVLQIQTQLAILKPKITTAELDLKVGASRLADMIGENEIENLSLIGDLIKINIKPQDFIKNKVVRMRTEIEKLNILQDQIIASKKMNLSKHFPQLNGVAWAGRNSTKSNDLTDSDRTGSYFGLQLVIPLFSGLSSVNESEEFASKGRQIELEREKLLKSFILDQIQTEKEFEASYGLHEASLYAKNLAEESLKEAQKLYLLGTATFLELTNAQRDLVEAENQYDLNGFGLIMKAAQFYVAHGLELEGLVEKLK